MKLIVMFEVSFVVVLDLSDDLVGILVGKHVSSSSETYQLVVSVSAVESAEWFGVSSRVY